MDKLSKLYSHQGNKIRKLHEADQEHQDIVRKMGKKLKKLSRKQQTVMKIQKVPQSIVF